MSRFKYGVLTDQAEAHQLGRLFTQCFISPAGSEGMFLDWIGVDNFRTVRTPKQLAGGLALLQMGQWWGGVCVPMTGIASVGIAPEHRGSGAAIALIQSVLQELHQQGVALSALYPATQRLYRKAGYEQAGHRCRWEIPAQAIQMKERSLPIEPLESLDRKTFELLYRQQAQTINGYLDRSTFGWTNLLHFEATEPLYAYRLGSADDAQGYVIFSQSRVGSGSILHIRDWAVTTPAAAQSLWTLLADHRSQVDTVSWRSSAHDWLSLLLPEQSAKLQSVERWMLRIVSLSSALEKRGYPQLTAELHLQVQDRLLPANHGRFILTVADGQGQVQTGGRGDLQLDIQSLGPLYSGLFTPHQLQQVGKLEATETALAIATQLFAGPSPWMPDFF